MPTVAEPSALQRALQELYRTLADVQELSERERGAFAGIAQRALLNSLGADLVVDEAEEALRRVA
jgi:hypothetical protein